MDYISEHFDIGQIASYTLLIRAGSYEHTLAVLNDKGQVMLLGGYIFGNSNQRIKEVFNADFHRVYITYRQDAFTFIPSEVYDEQYLSHYLSFVSKDAVPDNVAVSDISSLGVKNIHVPNPMSYFDFVGRFPHAQIVPDAHVLLQVAGNNLLSQKGEYIGIDKHENRLSFYCFNAGEFCFYNNVASSDAADFNYYLLNISAKLGLSLDKMCFVVSGDIASGDVYHNVMRKYSDNIHFADTAMWSGVDIPQSVREDQHRFLVVLGLYTCVS